MIKVKRVYDSPNREDGRRYLVDRLWPRGVSKTDADLTDWLKDLAPSEDLRKWFGHDPARWGEFKRRYKLELRAKAKKALLGRLAEEAATGPVTLVYAARDEEHNNAVVLAEVIDRA